VEVIVDFIDENRDELGLEHVLRGEVPGTLGQGTARRGADPAVVAIWEANFRVYGVLKLWKATRRAGHDVGRDQVARLMGRAGIEGLCRGKKRKTTKADPVAERHPDLVKRAFAPSARTPCGCRI
jgi:transposase InsO family protein